MTQLVGQGGTTTLDAFYSDGTGAAHDPTVPQVSIIDPTGAVVVSLAAPTRVSLGHFQYDYTPAVDAMLGAWEAQWFGLVNGVQVGPVDDGFTVVAAGSISAGSVGGITCEPWATFSDAPASLATADASEVNDAYQVASDMLFELTRRRYPGRCTDTIRPQAQWRKTDGLPMWWPSTASGSSPFGWCSCHRGRETGCARMPEIKLPGHPVDPDSIVVTIDGLSFAGFRLDDKRYLVRTDGAGWPCCQNLLDADDQPNTWSVLYRFGNRPPLGGKMACVALGTQLFLAYHGDFEGAGACRLPKRVTHITRAGTSIAILDPLTLFADGLTGLAEVDQWVATTNLGTNRRAATVIVPGQWRGSRRVGR